ncbi:MAG: TetR/AcrR family transcriptional regulator [Acidimicrobiia bacterium]
MGDVNREYRQTTRAERAAETRRRIVAAAVELHRSLGPAATSLSAVAREAGVSRPTLYAHFPDEASLFQACTMHWLSQDPPPDPTAWTQIDDPAERVAVALGEIYSHYGRNEELIDNVFRDMYVVESMRSFNVPLMEAAFAAMTEVLTTAFGDDEGRASRRRAVVAVAISFDTWKVLVVRQGLDERVAVELMTQLVVAAV